MYVIFVEVPITAHIKQYGFFTKCYQASVNGERGTWIGYTMENNRWQQIKQFKTLKAAENKLKFLEQKIDENGYMWDWKLSIQEIKEEDLV